MGREAIRNIERKIGRIDKRNIDRKIGRTDYIDNKQVELTKEIQIERQAEQIIQIISRQNR